MCIPAVDHGGASSGRSFGFDPADEAQQTGSMKWHAMIGPASKMKLTDLSDLCHAPLTDRVCVSYSVCCSDHVCVCVLQCFLQCACVCVTVHVAV